MVEAIRQGDIPGVQLRRRQPLALPVAAAWAWLVDPALLARWLADAAEVAPGANGHLLLSGTDERGPFRERGRTLEVAPPRRWTLAFERLDAGWEATTRLVLTLHDHPEGAELDVLQEGFQRLPLSMGLTVWEAYRLRWRTALERLAAAIADSPSS